MLRATIEIVPFGDEKKKHGIFRLDIGNVRTVRDEGFGHVICSYVWTMYRDGNEVLKEGPWVTEMEGFINEHDRRDGALALVQKVIQQIENPPND